MTAMSFLTSGEDQRRTPKAFALGHGSFQLAMREWMSTSVDEPFLGETTGWLVLKVGEHVLTRHVDVWSRTVRDAVLMSAYPLALWLAVNWWRLHYEPLPVNRVPSLEWRLSHELGAAARGYVWPRVVIASAGDSVQIWAEAMANPRQSVQYLTGLPGPVSVPLSEFTSVVEGFIQDVMARLQAVGQSHSELAELWAIIRAEREDDDLMRLRRMEAQLGYDPEECPSAILQSAKDFAEQVGGATLDELLPLFGRESGRESIDLESLAKAEGLDVSPQAECIDVPADGPPWKQGVVAAQRLRQQIGQFDDETVSDEALAELLGVRRFDEIADMADPTRPAGILRPSHRAGARGRSFTYLPRKRHPYARRFECARMLGDWLTQPALRERGWGVTSDLYTARQKRQRAFAAELLCPIDALRRFSHDEVSETAIEEAGHHFRVSEQVVRMQLVNHGLLPSHEPSLPYRLQQEPKNPTS